MWSRGRRRTKLRTRGSATLDMVPWPCPKFRFGSPQILLCYFEKIRPNFPKLSSRNGLWAAPSKFELLFPQLFERGAEDYVDRGRRGVAGRARSGVQAPGHSLQPIVSVIPALNDATSGGTASGPMDPPRETKRASFSKVGLFRSCAPDRPNLEKKAGESRTHPNLETNFAKLRPGPIRKRYAPPSGGKF